MATLPLSHYRSTTLPPVPGDIVYRITRVIPTKQLLTQLKHYVGKLNIKDVWAMLYPNPTETIVYDKETKECYAVSNVLLGYVTEQSVMYGTMQLPYPYPSTTLLPGEWGGRGTKYTIIKWEDVSGRETLLSPAHTTTAEDSYVFLKLANIYTIDPETFLENNGEFPS